MPSAFVVGLAVAPDGRIYGGGFDELGYVTTTATGRPEWHPLKDKLPAEFRPLGRVWSTVVHGGAGWFSANAGPFTFEVLDVAQAHDRLRALLDLGEAGQQQRRQEGEAMTTSSLMIVKVWCGPVARRSG